MAKLPKIKLIIVLLMLFKNLVELLGLLNLLELINLQMLIKYNKQINTHIYPKISKVKKDKFNLKYQGNFNSIPLKILMKICCKIYLQLDKIYHLKIYKNKIKINKIINKEDGIINIRVNSKIIQNNKILGIRAKQIIKMEMVMMGFCYEI